MLTVRAIIFHDHVILLRFSARIIVVSESPNISMVSPSNFTIFMATFPVLGAFPAFAYPVTNAVPIGVWLRPPNARHTNKICPFINLFCSFRWDFNKTLMGLVKAARLGNIV